MTPEQLEDLAVRLPSVRAFFDAMADSAMGGSHLVIGTGTSAASGSLFRRAMDDALNRRRGPTLRVVALGGQSASESPSRFLARALDDNEARFAVAAPSAPYVSILDILWLDGSTSTADVAASWHQYLKTLGKRPGAMDFAIVWAVPASGSGKTVETISDETWLRVARWWEHLSMLEWRVLCRLASESQTSAAALWREAVLPELAGPHPQLLSTLWNVVLTTEVEIFNALTTESRWLSTDRNAMRRALDEALRSPTRSERAPGPWSALLARGAAQNGYDHGIEPTAAALASAGDTEALRQRLWRGQSTLLLPWLTSLRQRFCQRLAQQHGRDWALRLASAFLAEDDRERFQRNPSSVEFPAVHAALRNSKAPTDLLDLAWDAWQLRNDVAHCEAVTFSKFESLFRRSQVLRV